MSLSAVKGRKGEEGLREAMGIDRQDCTTEEVSESVTSGQLCSCQPRCQLAPRSAP